MKTPALAFILFLLSITVAKAQFKLETPAATMEYLDKAGVSYDKNDLAVYKDFNTWGYIMQYKNNEFPAVYFFNTEGKNVKLKDYSCSQALNIEKINTSKVNKKEDDINWWLSDLAFLTEDENRFSKAYDSYILIFWTKMASKGSNETAFNWYKSVKEKNDPNIKVFLINFDIMDTWEISDKNKEALNLE